MKKAIWFVLIILLLCIFSFSACDKGETPSNNNDTPSTQQPSDDNNDNNPDDNKQNNNTQCQHTWGEWLTVKNASCKDEGQLIRVCSKCSVSEQTTVAKTDTHTEVIDAAISATCTADGKTEGKHCSTCGITLIEQTTVKATGHTEVVDKAVAATCKAEGKTEGKHCSVCNDVIVKQDAIPKSDHIEVIDEAVSPTCTTEGKTEGKHCSVCGTVIVEQTSVPKSNHTEAIDDAVSPTCTSEGKTEGKHCSVCKKVIVAQTSINTIAHTFEGGACTMCKSMDVDSKNAEINAENARHEESLRAIKENHDYWISYAQDQISSIKSLYGIDDVYSNEYCYSCIDEIDDEISLLEKYISALSGDNSSSAAAQRQRYKAQIAEKEEEKDTYYAHIDINDWQDEIELEELSLEDDILVEKTLHDENLKKINAKYECAVKGHTIVIDVAVAPTCTTDGRTEGKHCSSCNTVFIEQTVILSGHKESDWIVEIEATSSENGLKYTKCTVCGGRIKEEIIFATGSIGLEYNVNSDNTTCVITGVGSCTDKKIYIPAIIDGYTVTEIASEAFAGQETITFIKLPDTITTIGSKAFYECTGITEITIPQSVTKIGTEIFGNCNKLTIVYYNAPYGSQDNSFLNVQSIQTVVFGGTFIPSYVAAGASNLKTVIILDTNEKIESSAFKNCSGLKSIEIPNSVTKIGYAAFNGCSGLETMTLPFVGGSAKTKYEASQYPLGYIFGQSSYSGGIAAKQKFHDYHAYSLSTSIYYIPATLKSVTITGGNILYGAFYDCSGLESIILPENITSIDGGAFYGCSSLAQITLPNSITSIGEEAFRGCSALESVVIPEGVINIGEQAFYSCSTLTSIMIPNGVSSIGDHTFCYCSNLLEITIGSNVTSIGKYAFFSCGELSTMKFNGTVEQWESITFGDKWSHNISATMVTCSNGSITLE